MPSSLKSEVLVRSRVESPEILEVRRQICQSKSVSELSQMQTLADFPIPTTIEKLMTKRSEKSEPAVEFDPSKLTENIYATLPKSLKSEVLVRSRVEEPEKLKFRQEVVQSKSVSELSQMQTLADFPVPSPIEKIMQGKTTIPVPKMPSSSR